MPENMIIEIVQKVRNMPYSEENGVKLRRYKFAYLNGKRRGYFWKLDERLADYGAFVMVNDGAYIACMP